MTYDCIQPRRRRLLPALVLLAVSARAPAAPGSAENEIRSVIEAQQEAWNRGEIDGFMAGYEASTSITFVGATVTHGFQQVLENYHRRYPTRAKMGRLAFSDLEVKLLGADYAVVIGKWHLARPADAGGDVGGIFTLILRKTAGGWKIILDHTS